MNRPRSVHGSCTLEEDATCCDECGEQWYVRCPACEALTPVGDDHRCPAS